MDSLAAMGEYARNKLGDDWSVYRARADYRLLHGDICVYRNEAAGPIWNRIDLLASSRKPE